MPVSKNKVLAAASLVRLEIATDTEAEQLAQQLSAIVQHMDILATVDTTGIEPMYSPMRNIAPPRDDIPSAGNNAKTVLSNAPEQHGTFFVVPPVL